MKRRNPQPRKRIPLRWREESPSTMLIRMIAERPSSTDPAELASRARLLATAATMLKTEAQLARIERG